MNNLRSQNNIQKPPIARPSDAASLIILRGSQKNPEVLLGQRRKDARFAPGVYVFPGGRVDRSDGAHARPYPARSDVVAKIARHSPERRANALVWAAIRETWEESGLLIGEPGKIDDSEKSPLHNAYADAGIRPGSAKLDYIGRAITPTRSPIRFNTRFFLTRATETHGILHLNSELEDIGWRTVSETLNDLKIMKVTDFALRAAVDYWRESPAPDPERPVPRFTHLQANRGI
ncbi:MAG: NUDIX domain-containing protein, partial [Alphaproteobacteria bacterium]|nr:NUDIX domain-containing protein [Alphaproteobacteria bacterium]